MCVHTEVKPFRVPMSINVPIKNVDVESTIDVGWKERWMKKLHEKKRGQTNDVSRK